MVLSRHILTWLVLLNAIAVGSTGPPAGGALDRYLASSQASVADLELWRAVYGCSADSVETATCRRLHERRLNSAGTANSTAEPTKYEVVEELQDDHLDDWLNDKMIQMDTIKLVVSWAYGRVIDDDYFYADEPAEGKTGGVHDGRRLQDPVWRGFQMAAGTPWPNRTVKYAWKKDIKGNAKRVLKSAMREIQEKSCITFEEVPLGCDSNGENCDIHPSGTVLFKSDEDGCWAQVGHSNGHPKCNLGWGCRWHGIAIHELLHSLGQTHEQCRSDRDFFVDFVESNLADKSKLHNFASRDKVYTALGYDFSSIMHYDRWAFSKNWASQDLLINPILKGLLKIGIDTGSPTLKAKTSHFATRIGQRSRMSNGDIEQLLHMYECPKLTLASDSHQGTGVGWRGGLTLTTGYQAEGVACSPGFVSTSCTCFHKGGDCRGAMFSSSTGGVCQAAGQRGASSGLKAHVICHKLSSPHYTSMRLSDTYKKDGDVVSASVGCGKDYRLVGCNCLTQQKANCHAIPVLGRSDGSSITMGTQDLCTATSTETVSAQAVCVKTIAINANRMELVTGAASTKNIQNSTAVCPSDTELTGCSCGSDLSAGVNHCAGAYATGTNSNTCLAKSAKEDKAVIAYALCAPLLSSGDVGLPAMDHFDYRDLQPIVKAKDVVDIWPVQSVYCDTGCETLSLQQRKKGAYDCGKRSGGGVSTACQTVNLPLRSTTVEIATDSADGQARCPAGYVLVGITCSGKDCKTLSVKCAAPAIDAPWFLSGGIMLTPFFSGSTGSAMGTCTESVAIGIQCGDDGGGPFSDAACRSKQVLCRRIAIAATDNEERHGQFDIRLIGGAWSKWISSTGAKESILQLDWQDEDSELQNSNAHPIQQVQCAGGACDDLRFYSPKDFGTFRGSIPLTGAFSIWTEPFTEGEMKCPAGHFVTGIQCSQSYCSTKSLLCASPAGDKWLVTGEPYYSHCFTNKASNTWRQWFRDFGDWVRGRSRTCVGTSTSNMPDSQSCGADGIVVGMRCYGSHCDRIQLLCATVDANVDMESGIVSSSTETRRQMVTLELYNDPDTWDDKPAGDKPALTSRWDGSAIIGGQMPTDPDANLLALGIASGATAVQLPFAAFAIGFFAAAVCRLN